MGKMSDIFLSYDREDRQKASSLASALEQKGLSVYWDRRMLPGQRFQEVILNEINSCRCLIVLWSHNSVNSDWVKSEADIGRSMRKLIPLSLDSATIPMAFRQIHTADLSKWRGNPGDNILHDIFDAVDLFKPDVVTDSNTIKKIESELKKPSSYNVELLWWIIGLVTMAIILGVYFGVPMY
jgi:hypothetical protein